MTLCLVNPERHERFSGGRHKAAMIPRHSYLRQWPARLGLAAQPLSAPAGQEAQDNDTATHAELLDIDHATVLPAGAATLSLRNRQAWRLSRNPTLLPKDRPSVPRQSLPANGSCGVSPPATSHKEQNESQPSKQLPWLDPGGSPPGRPNP